MWEKKLIQHSIASLEMLGLFLKSGTAVRRQSSPVFSVIADRKTMNHTPKPTIQSTQTIDNDVTVHVLYLCNFNSMPNMPDIFFS